MSAASRAQEEESSRHVRHLVRIDKRERGRKGREGEERGRGDMWSGEWGTTIRGISALSSNDYLWGSGG